MPKKNKKVARYCPNCHNITIPEKMKDTSTGEDKVVYYCEVCDRLYSEIQTSIADPSGWFAKKLTKARARKK